MKFSFKSMQIMVYVDGYENTIGSFWTTFRKVLKRNESVEIISKIQPFKGIYYAKIYWNYYINQTLQIEFGAPNVELCAARNMLSLH
jgi:hypothetical protein